MPEIHSPKQVLTFTETDLTFSHRISFKHTLVYISSDTAEERFKDLLLLAFLNRLTSLSIERAEKIPRRVTAMTYACPEWLGYRNFGMPEVNSTEEDKRRTSVFTRDTPSGRHTFGYSRQRNTLNKVLDIFKICDIIILTFQNLCKNMCLLYLYMYK